MATLVEVLEELLARQVLHAAHDSGDAPIGKRNCVRHATLAPEAQLESRAMHARLALAQRRQAKGIVGTGVFGIADAHIGPLKKAHDRSDGFFPGQSGPRQVARHATPNTRQRVRESGEPFVLRFVPHVAPALVVAVLFAPLRVAAGRLDMAIGAGADPYARPGRRNGKPPNALERRAVAHEAAARRNVPKGAGRSSPLDPRNVVSDVLQAGRSG